MAQNALKPKALTRGCRIGVVSPARAAKPEQLAAGKAALEAQGFEVVLHPQNSKKEFQLAGSDRERAGAINDFFADKSIDGIVCARGGIGSYRTLPFLDFESIEKKPKVFCGFSDITTLLQAINARTGLITFHGPMLISMTDVYDPINAKHFADFFLKPPSSGPYAGAEAIRHGHAEGKMVGGNITLLQHLIGTADDFDTEGKILFIEDDDGEKISDIDRALWHFRKAGKFQGLAGLIVGAFTGFRDDPNGDWGRDIGALIRELVPQNIPIALNFPCGHGKTIMPLPVGATARLETNEKGVFVHFPQSLFA